MKHRSRSAASLPLVPGHGRSTGLPTIAVIAALLLSAGATIADGMRQITDSRGTAVGAVALTDDRVVSVTNDVPGSAAGGAFQIRIADVDGASPAAVTGFLDSVEPRSELIDVSHDGQWIAFASHADPLGTNLDRSLELFVIASNGSALTQLTNDPGPLAGEIRELAISGDGDSLIFVSTSDLTTGNPNGLPLPFRIDRDGSSLKQMSPDPVAPSSIPGVSSISISSDGSRATFFSLDDIDGSNPALLGKIYRAAGDGSSFALWFADLGASPRISGDGSSIAFLSSFDLLGTNPGFRRQIFADDWLPGALTQVTSLSSDVIEFDVNEDASHYALLSKSDDLGSNADGNRELFSMIAGSLVQETDTATGVCRDLRLSEAGSHAGLLCDGDDPFFGGGNPDGNVEALTVSIGSGANRVSATRPVAARAIDLSLDASRFLVVSQLDDPTDPSSAIGGGLFAVGGGTTFTLLTATVSEPSTPAAMSGDGAVVVYADAQVTPGNPDGSQELYVVPSGGGAPLQLTSAPAGSIVLQPHLDESGSTVVFTCNGDLTGFNPSNRLQVFVMATAGGGLQQLSDGASFASLNPRINLDGTHATYLSDDRVELRELASPVSIVIASGATAPAGGNVTSDVTRDARYVVYSDVADPLSTNPEGNAELFRYDTDTGTLEQLTSTTDGINASPVFSGNGQWVWFYSSAPWFEDDPDSPFWLYRVSTVGPPLVERIGGLGFGSAPLFVGDFRVDDSGDRGVVYDLGDPTGINRDRQSDAFLVDTTREAVLTVDDRTATRIAWTPEAGPLRYDVVRGDLDALSPSGTSGTSLGALVCIENDSPDLDTRWLEDTDVPAPGTGYFYVVRGADGLAAPTGSYGSASAGGERVPGVGDCSP
ncbi:MAG: hypothetical protein GY716_07170 [bacterium]|nr:hypothetical protein [bacterium]